jgi:hypothetical protein
MAESDNGSEKEYFVVTVKEETERSDGSYKEEVMTGLDDYSEKEMYKSSRASEEQDGDLEDQESSKIVKRSNSTFEIPPQEESEEEEKSESYFSAVPSQ